MKRLEDHAARPLAASLLAGAILLGLAAPAFAQAETDMQPATQPGMGLPEGNSPEEVAQRRAANEEQLRKAQAQNEQNDENQANYQQALSEYKASVEQYEQEKSAVEAEKARIAREHEEAVAKWQADVAACQAGDYSRCAPQPAAPR